MESLKKEGLTKSIGVSNYGVHHLEELFEAAEVRPAVNQIEVNPFITRTALTRHCLENRVAVQAYSPLTKGLKLGDPNLLAIADKNGLTAAQVMIRWCLQKGYVVIPKSVHGDRIRENANVFAEALCPADMAALDALDEHLVTGWDPTSEP